MKPKLGHTYFFVFQFPQLKFQQYQLNSAHFSQQNQGNHAAACLFNLRNRFTETFSVNTSEEHAQTTAAACALCAYG